MHHQHFVCGAALLGAVLCTALCVPCRTALVGSGQWNFCNALPNCLGPVGSATRAMHCLTTWRQWAAQLLQCTASLPGGSGQWSSCFAPPHCPVAVGCGTPVMHCHTAQWLWVVQLLQCTASLPGGSGQCNSCNAMHCLIGWGRWAVELLQCAGPSAGGTGSPAQEAVAA